MTLRNLILMGALAAVVACGGDDSATGDGNEGGSEETTATGTGTSGASTDGTETSAGPTTASSTSESSTDSDGSTGTGTSADSSTGEDPTSDGSTGTDASSSSDGTTGAACEPITQDTSAIGDACEDDEDCPEGYTCFDGGGIVSQPLCRILCTESCECPTNYTCEFHDIKGNQWHECDP